MIRIDGQPVRVVQTQVTTEMYAAWEASPVTFANQPQADLDALLAAAPTAPDEVLVELVRVLRKIEFDWDGEPEDMADARAILARVEVDNA